MLNKIFENFRNCLKRNIDSRMGYGSLGEIGIECRDNLKEFVKDRLRLMGTEQFFHKQDC